MQLGLVVSLAFVDFMCVAASLKTLPMTIQDVAYRLYIDITKIPISCRHIFEALDTGAILRVCICTD